MLYKKIICAVMVIATLAWIGFIWSNSMKNGQESGEMSHKTQEIINHVSQQIGVETEVTEKVVRKSAHFTEFFVLGGLLCVDMLIFGIASYRRNISQLLLLLCSPVVSFFIASADEFIQRFSEGRCCQFTDVLIDFGGACASTAIILAVLFIVRRVLLKHQGDTYKPDET